MLTRTDPNLTRALKELAQTLDELTTVKKQLERQSHDTGAAQEALRAERARYRELFDLAPDPYLVTDRQAIIREANQAAARLLNIRPEHLIGKPLAVFVEKGAKKDFLAELTEIAKSGQLKNWQLRLSRRGSASVVVSAAVSLHYVEVPTKKLELRWALHDLTEQHETAERVRESQERYRSLFENAQEGISRSTPDGRIVTANPALAKMLGYESPEELLRLRLWDDLYADPNTRKKLLEEAGEAPENALRNREIVLKKKDGGLLVASLSIRGIRDARGRIIAYEKLVHDITERKKMEERLRQRERLAAVGSTVAVLTHEISNPLQGMSTVIQTMEHQMRGKEEENPVLVSHLRDLRTETHRLADLLHDFRLLAQTQYTFEPVVLHELIAEVLSLQAVYTESGIRVETDVPAQLPPIMADRSKLKQALLNLCKNAAEAMSGGGLLRIKGTSAGGQVVLHIKDDGPGIPQGVDIFEPFVTTKEYGTGLGLPIVRQIVSGHGGSIVQNSEPGRGTTFCLILPVEQKT